MSEYSASVRWVRGEGEAFVDDAYSRGHEWRFDGGACVAASASANVVPLAYCVEAHVDPEEAFVASLSSCHMLFFLSIAAQEGLVVDEYIDDAVGVLESDCEDKISITHVTLRPAVRFSGANQPTLAQLEAMHYQSHEQCFIANSVKTRVVTEIVAGPEDPASS
jgi:organic hydroperoxide reductase OsmC/OhrA